MYSFKDLLDLKRDKSGIKIMRQWLFNGKQFNEVTIAKAMSSTLTHALIELENNEDIDLAEGYGVAFLSDLLNNLVQGRSNIEVIRRIMIARINEERNSEL